MDMKHVVAMIREPNIRKLWKRRSSARGCGARPSPARPQVSWAALEAVPVQAAFIDGDMSGVDDEFLRAAASVQPCLAMAVFVDRAALESVRHRATAGAGGVPAKPFTLEAVRNILAKAAHHRAHGEQPAVGAARGCGLAGGNFAGDRRCVARSNRDAPRTDHRPQSGHAQRC